jgi:hypothetical protein
MKAEHAEQKNPKKCYRRRLKNQAKEKEVIEEKIEHAKRPSLRVSFRRRISKGWFRFLQRRPIWHWA